MESFSDSLLKKREALLLFNRRSESPYDPKTESIGLVPTVHYWLKSLLKRGYTFSEIVEESGVNPLFLEQTYRELKLDEKVPDDLYKGSGSGVRASCSGLQTVSDGNRKDIEVEIRHFMFKTLLEMNRITASLQRSPVRERLRDDKIKHEVSKNLKRIAESSQDLLKKIEIVSNTSLTDAADIEKGNSSKSSSILERVPKRMKRENSQTDLMSGSKASENLVTREQNSEIWANKSSLNPDTESSTLSKSPKTSPNERIQPRQSKVHAFTPYRSLISNHGR